MAMQKQIFEQAGRFDEYQLPVAYNDVDLCLKVRALGYRNVYTPWAQMLHHESATRGEDTDPVKRQRLATEEAMVRQRWRHIIDADPMYNPHLSLQSEHVELAAP
jgi:GT2 family glycosyltransferase